MKKTQRPDSRDEIFVKVLEAGMNVSLQTAFEKSMKSAADVKVGGSLMVALRKPDGNWEVEELTITSQLQNLITEMPALEA